MTLRHSFLGQFSPVLTVFLLSGCLSTVDMLTTAPILSKQNLYNQSRLDWQNAAVRKNDLFSQHRLHIFAAVSWKKRSDASTYQLIDITIGHPSYIDEQYKLDLISPDFSQKMACGWYCEYLDHPIMQKVLGPYTMLDKTFESQRVDLLNFYQSLERLNQNLNALDPTLQALLPEVFADLAQNDQSFDSLSNIAGFLNDYFDDIDFDTLLARQEALISNENESLVDGNNKALAAIDNDLALLVSQKPSLDPEAKMLASFRPEVSLAQITNLTSKPKQEALFIDKILFKEDAGTLANIRPNNKQDMTDYKPDKNALYIGQFACSFKDNYFGVVTAIKGEIVSLKLNGQAKIITDGLLEEAQDGLLFLTDTEFSYFSLDSDKDFKQDQLKSCYLSGFS